MTTLLNFSDLGLFAPILGALAAEGYTAPSATPPPRNDPIERQAELPSPGTFGLASPLDSAGGRAAPARRGRQGGAARRSETIAAASRPIFLHRRSPTKPSWAARREPPRGRSPAARFDALAERIQRRARDMLIARDGEELVCPKGTLCGRLTRDANDQVTDGDFAMLETCVSLGDQRYVCACCERAVAVREHFRWRVHLRRGWIR